MKVVKPKSVSLNQEPTRQILVLRCSCHKGN